MNLILASVLLFVCSFSIAATCPKNGNVKELFLSATPALFEVFDDVKGPLKNKAEIEKSIAVVDLKNGYLELQNNTILSKISSALFVSKGRRTLLVTEDGVSVQNKYAYRCENGNWVDVTKLTFPVLSYERIAELYKSKKVLVHNKIPTADELSKVAHTLVRFQLPRTGKKIKAIASHPDASEMKELFQFTID